jgi:hypothetical protein
MKGKRPSRHVRHLQSGRKIVVNPMVKNRKVKKIGNVKTFDDFLKVKIAEGDIDFENNQPVDLNQLRDEFNKFEKNREAYEKVDNDINFFLARLDKQNADRKLKHTLNFATNDYKEEN